MELEVAVLREALENVQEVRQGDFFFWTGKLGKRAVVSRTGIGTAAASAATALWRTLFQPCLVLNQGTAGGYPVDLEPLTWWWGNGGSTGTPCTSPGMGRIIT